MCYPSAMQGYKLPLCRLFARAKEWTNVLQKAGKAAMLLPVVAVVATELRCRLICSLCSVFGLPGFF